MKQTSSDQAPSPAFADLCLPEWSGSDEELLNAREAGLLLTVKPSTLLAWAREGRVPVIRLGPRHLRWTRVMLREIRDSAIERSSPI